MDGKRAFTLIELLVVIAIIAVLAAILFPVFAAAKSAAKRDAAMNNLSQIGKAVHMYLADYDDHLPFRFKEIPSWPGYRVIIHTLGDDGFSGVYGPYIKDSKVWFSPEDRLSDKGYTSFAINHQLAFDWACSSIARPSEAIYATDRTDVAGTVPLDTYTWWQFLSESGPFDESKLPGTVDPVAVATQIDPIRYSGSNALYLFLDSHVAAMTFGRTWGDASHNLHLPTKP